MAADSPKVHQWFTRRRIMFLTMVTTVTIALAGFLSFGPRQEDYSTCPLTGRDRMIVTRLGITISDRVSTNGVSVWAEANSVDGIVVGQCGWTPISTVTTHWFAPQLFGESMQPMIPYSLYRGLIKLPDLTPEEALQKYQQAIMAAFNANKSLWQVHQEFLQAGSR
jgi:hypothetical protein